MIIPVFCGKYTYFTELNLEIDKESLIYKMEEMLVTAEKNRDKSWGKLMNDKMISSMSEKGLWEDLFLEEQKWTDSYWEASRLRNAIELIGKLN